MLARKKVHLSVLRTKRCTFSMELRRGIWKNARGAGQTACAVIDGIFEVSITIDKRGRGTEPIFPVPENSNNVNPIGEICGFSS